MTRVERWCLYDEAGIACQHMSRSWTVAALAANIRKVCRRCFHFIPGSCPEAHHMAGDASRVMTPMDLQKILEGTAVRSELPLGVLTWMAGRTVLGSKITTFPYLLAE